MVLVTLMLLSSLQPIDVEAKLRAARRGGGLRGDVPYVAPSERQVQEEAALFRALFGIARAGRLDEVAALEAAAEPLGLRVVVGRDGESGPPLAIVVEGEGRRRGAGVYLVRLGPAPCEAFVQAPHSFSDRGTLAPALALFRALGARALAANSVHRRRTRDSDVAHSERSTFHAATTAWLEEGRGALVVQIHGFVDQPRDADAVISAGTGAPAPAWLSRAKGALAGAIPGVRVAAYPDDVRLLGAETNVQARAARHAGVRFLHIELRASLRARGGRILVPALRATVRAACDAEPGAR